jgi:hypothetical protein
VRFTASELEQFAIDPTRRAYWGTCPWCGLTIVLGHRKDTGNVCIAHEGFPDPMQQGAMLCGCEVFRELASTNQVELLRLLRTARLRLQPLTL